MKKYILLFGLMSFYGLYSYTNAIECSFYEFEDQCVSPGGQVKMSETNSDLPHFTRGLDAKIFTKSFDSNVVNNRGAHNDNKLLWEWKANDDGEPDGEFKSCEDFENRTCSTNGTFASITSGAPWNGYAGREEWRCMEGACESFDFTEVEACNEPDYRQCSGLTFQHMRDRCRGGSCNHEVFDSEYCGPSTSRTNNQCETRSKSCSSNYSCNCSESCSTDDDGNETCSTTCDTCTNNRTVSDTDCVNTTRIDRGCNASGGCWETTTPNAASPNPNPSC
ncbi:hypothetical protein [Candidatus Vampirococcus lugosii]|uniref:Uncharacterized protein n=1 Tax=Candidatus Vampirococcus lugosii TaxID=2789015 RepID=A0ABS5QKL0_9BACT|nr:hypothetical protein [Candidatus Vampirococcus lugosii]MBS8121713.1 hypothetical protein [Candidatus Vampirococcus lugosii]